jgi:membrane fusion protein (multidrug efflux system)
MPKDAVRLTRVKPPRWISGSFEKKETNRLGGILTVRPCTFGTLACLLAAVLVTACSKEKAAEQQRPAPQVGVVTVAAATIPYTINFVAQTESSRQVEIVARVSGFLDKIAYQEGELVKEGQVLFQLDQKPFQAQLDAAKGELFAQQARFSTAKSNLDRVKPLAQQDALSKADLDRAQGDYDAANAAVYAASAKLREAELNLGYTVIRAPVTGLASRSQQRQGAFINAMTETAQLTYVAAIDPIWVNFSVSQNQMAQLRDEVSAGRVVMPKGQTFQVELAMSDGSIYPEKGTINFADPNFSQDTGSFLVRAVIPNPKRDLRPGMFVTARVGGYVRPDAIVIPQLSVQQGSNGHLVYVVKPDNTAEVRPVVVGDYLGDKDIVILDGLRAGDKVVTDGVLKVVPGKPVQIAAAGSAASAGEAASAPPKAAGPPKQ